MDWDKLRIFHAVADAGSLTHAGDALKLSQSAVSRQIRELETELGVEIFVRAGKRLTGLTAPGEVVPAQDYNLFWSLSFALTADTWRRIEAEFGGFDEGFSGYGGEDTDFARQLREHGIEPYPYRFDRSHTLSEVRAEWGGLPEGTETDHAVAVAGRIMLKRDSGKLVFATVRDRDGEIQLFVSQAVVGEEVFAGIKALDLGDWVGVHGTVMTTRKGELSVKVERLELLAKAVRPLPDKWHGLTDTDTRFRQRYADLIVNDDAR